MLIYNPPHNKIRVHPCAKNIRAIRAIRVQRKNSIRVPKTFDIRYSCSKKEFHPCAKNIRAIRAIRVQKKQSAQVPHTNAEPRRATFILSGMPGDYHSHLPTRTFTSHHFTTFLPLTIYIP